ncbi:protein kinase [Actinomadura verrucosospora]|uniref:Protein kinase n=1 Tax=Actinomadura verrucosospora TaxID=46165 RepID=A0A7D3VQL9_ACTVE|nr:protein kinase [Actinomadura verrucosospora]
MIEVLERLGETGEAARVRSEARAFLESRAEDGHADAMYDLAVLLEQAGEAEESDLLCERAAALGSREAREYLRGQ